jgi:spermidine/putrescine transport system ATP-binding protein
MRGQDVRLEDFSVTYANQFTAVHQTDLTVSAGEFFSILGPSGCGKTTVLRAISGFIEPTRGRVLIGGQDQRGIGPNARPTALIFQNLALFPLMSVWENVAFGLEARGAPRARRHARALELLDLVALSAQADKKPPELSGGQRQRVAIARALAVEPAVLLLDEPLSALDLKLRQHMRAELRAIQKKTGVTFIYITHDQGEALTMSDRVAVMNEGRIAQVGPGDEIYARPASPFVASFVGETNMFPGIVRGARDGIAEVDTALGPLRALAGAGLCQGSEAMIFVRPERLRLVDGADAADNLIAATVSGRALEGPFITLHLSAAGGAITLHQPNTGPAGRDPGGAQTIGFSAHDALALPKGALAKTGQELAT